MNNEICYEYHADADALRAVSNWLVFGTMNFGNGIERSYRSVKDNFVGVVPVGDKVVDNKWTRRAMFQSTFRKLAHAYSASPRHLVYFVNNAYKADKDYHHIHFLLGAHNLTKNAKEACNLLKVFTEDFGGSKCEYYEFDVERNGIEYCCKVEKDLKGNTIPPAFYYSPTLMKVIGLNKSNYACVSKLASKDEA